MSSLRSLLFSALSAFQFPVTDCTLNPQSRHERFRAAGRHAHRRRAYSPSPISPLP
jgi:hypothetical protein